MGRAARAGVLLGAGLFALGAGCAGDDACRGRDETCVSLTLLASEGVSEADQLQVMVKRAPSPTSPMMPLGSPQRLPFKVAVLWPDGPGTVSVRSFSGGTLNGVTPELALDLRGGAHARYALTLFPPLPGGGDKLDMGAGDLRARDLRPAPDLRPEEDLAVPEDLSVPDLRPADGGADMTMPRDLAMVAPDMTMPMGDMGMPDLASD